MTLDTASNHVIVGFRHPAVLVVYDGQVGKEISRTELVDDVDDVFYDGASQQVFASGGGGYINIFQKTSDKSYKRCQKSLQELVQEPLFLFLDCCREGRRRKACCHSCLQVEGLE